MNHTYSADYLAIALEDLLRAIDGINPVATTIEQHCAIRRINKAKAAARESLGNFYALDDVDGAAVRPLLNAIWKDMQ